MSDQPSRKTRDAPSGANSGERPESAAARDIDAEGRPLMRQEDEAPGTGGPGVGVGRPDAMSTEQVPGPERDERDDQDRRRDQGRRGGQDDGEKQG